MDDGEAADEDPNGAAGALASRARQPPWPERSGAAAESKASPATNAFLSPSADRSSSLFDYVRRPVMFVCEGEEVRARAEKSLEQLSASYADVTARGSLVPPPEDLFLPLDDLDVMLDAATQLDELQIGDQGSDRGSRSRDRGPGIRSTASSHPPWPERRGGAAESKAAPLA